MTSATEKESSGKTGSVRGDPSPNCGLPDGNQSGESSAKPEFGSYIVGILIGEDYVSPAQVDYARKVHQRLDTPKSLLEVLKELGYVREEHVKEALFKNQTGIRIGTLLVELGYITEHQLAIALTKQEQSKNRERLGKILVENHYISEYDLTRVLSMQLGFPYIEPKPEMVDLSLLRKAPRKVFLSQVFVPLGREKGSVKLAMGDPQNASTVTVAKQLFGTDLNRFIAMETSIKATLEACDSLVSHKRRFEASKSQIVELVDQMIKEALKKQASDIHIEPMKNRVRIRFRKDGSLIHHRDLSKDLESAVVNRIKIMASANITERRRHQDGRILLGSSGNGGEIDIRVSFYVTVFGEKFVMRILTKKAELYKIEDLGMAPKMLERFREEVLDVPTGVDIITGPTGAGKTTTLYAAVNYCNKIDTSIISAEEPVEYIIEGMSQCSINPRIGVTFEESLRHMLRQDPDIIVLGEIRDKISAESAIQAALTGQKVLTTFHTEDSIGGLLRLMNMDIETFLISSTVVSVVAQRLLKKVCPDCREAYVPTSRDLRRLQYRHSNLSQYRFQRGAGCERCDFTGYQGRIGIFELLVLNEYVKDTILNRKSSYEIRRVGLETTGLVTLLEDGLAKASRGMTSLQEVIRHLPLLEAPRPLDQIYRMIGAI